MLGDVVSTDHWALITPTPPPSARRSRSALVQAVVAVGEGDSPGSFSLRGRIGSPFIHTSSKFQGANPQPPTPPFSPRPHGVRAYVPAACSGVNLIFSSRVLAPLPEAQREASNQRSPHPEHTILPHSPRGHSIAASLLGRADSAEHGLQMHRSSFPNGEFFIF